MPDVIDDTQLVTITLTQEGAGAFVSHTFPPSAGVGTTVNGIITVRNDGPVADTILASLISSPAVAFSPSNRQEATLNPTNTYGFPFSFTMPASGVDITINVGHVE